MEDPEQKAGVDAWAAEGEVVSSSITDALRREFGELGLSLYESRVLLALLRLGSANTLQLARVADVPRTSTYQVLESLASRRLAVRLPGGRAAVWAAANRDEVFERLEAGLEAAHAERVRQHREHAAQARKLLAETVPAAPSVAFPYVHMLMGPAEVRNAYDQMLAQAKHELLMFTRPPYAGVVGRPQPAVLDMLARRVSARVLYQADKWEEPEAHAFRQEVTVYHEAGVKARLVESLPIKLILVDRRVAMVGMTDPVAPEAGYPISLLIEHPGYATIQAEAFERLWETARPLTSIPAAIGGGFEGIAEHPELADLADLAGRESRPEQS